MRHQSDYNFHNLSMYNEYEMHMTIVRIGSICERLVKRDKGVISGRNIVTGLRGVVNSLLYEYAKNCNEFSSSQYCST